MVPQPAVVGTAVAQVDQRPDTLGESDFGLVEARGDGICHTPSVITLAAIGERAELPGLDTRPQQQLREAIGVAAIASIADGVALLTPFEVAECEACGDLAFLSQIALCVATRSNGSLRSAARHVAEAQYEIVEAPQPCVSSTSLSCAVAQW